MQKYIQFMGKILRFIRKKKQKRKNPVLTTYAGNNTSVLECCIAYNKFGGYCVPLSSYQRAAAQKILRGETHEKNTVEYIMNNCDGGDIVHAGAYFGDSLPAFSHACSPNQKIWAFEPHPENYRCALITKLINNLENVELINGGLGAKQDYSHLIIEDPKGIPLGGGSYIVQNKSSKNNYKTLRVPVYTLDRAIPKNRNISILHLDVEGYEKYALEGSMYHIKKSKPMIILEIYPDQELLNRYLTPLGYKYKGGVSRNRNDVFNHVFAVS